jgi:hypothetical protein
LIKFKQHPQTIYAARPLLMGAVKPDITAENAHPAAATP